MLTLPLPPVPAATKRTALLSVHDLGTLRFSILVSCLSLVEMALLDHMYVKKLWIVAYMSLALAGVQSCLAD